jgi:signal transduction histidine kinase
MLPATRLRLRLTAWYAGTFSLIVAVLGFALYTEITHRLAAPLAPPLPAAAPALERAAQIRDNEAPERAEHGGTPVADAVSELVIPGRMLYLFDSSAHPVVPDSASADVRASAARALSNGVDDKHFKIHHDAPNERKFEVHAERFRLTSGRQYVAAVVADRVELEDKYATLIYEMIGAATGAIFLVAVGGWFLAGKAIEPIERSLAYMRRFVAEAAHELRTPVAVLRSRADVALQREREPAAYVGVLTAMGLEAERMGRIVNDLLTLARADAGERAVARQSLYLDDVAMDAVGGAQVLAERRGVELDVRQFEEAPVVADPGLVRQLLVIILDNAVKFTQPGGRVSLSVRSVDGRSTVTITDTGVGIPPGELPRIYDRFYRGDDARRRSDGAGLGLSIAKWIADTHGAVMTVVSELGRGTEVTVSFPPV